MAPDTNRPAPTPPAVASSPRNEHVSSNAGQEQRQPNAEQIASAWMRQVAQQQTMMMNGQGPPIAAQAGPSRKGRVTQQHNRPAMQPRPGMIEFSGAGQPQMSPTNVSPRHRRTPHNVDENEYFARQVEVHQHMLNPQNFHLPERVARQFSLPTEGFQYNDIQMRSASAGIIGQRAMSPPVTLPMLSPGSSNLRRPPQRTPSGDNVTMTMGYPRPRSATNAAAMNVPRMHRASPAQEQRMLHASQRLPMHSEPLRDPRLRMPELSPYFVDVINKAVDDFTARKLQLRALQYGRGYGRIDPRPIVHNRTPHQVGFPTGNMMQRPVSRIEQQVKRRTIPPTPKPQGARWINIDFNGMNWKIDLSKASSKQLKEPLRLVRLRKARSTVSQRRIQARRALYSKPAKVKGGATFERIKQTYLSINEDAKSLTLVQRWVYSRDICKITPNYYPILFSRFRPQQLSRSRSMSLPTDFGPASIYDKNGQVTKTVAPKNKEKLLALGSKYVETSIDRGLNETSAMEFLALVTPTVRGAPRFVQWLNRRIHQVRQRLTSSNCDKFKKAPVPVQDTAKQQEEVDDYWRYDTGVHRFTVSQEDEERWNTTAPIGHYALLGNENRVWKEEYESFMTKEEFKNRSKTIDDIEDDVKDEQIMDVNEGAKDIGQNQMEQGAVEVENIEKEPFRNNNSILEGMDELMSLEELDALLDDESCEASAQLSESIAADDTLNGSIIGNTAMELDDVFTDPPRTRIDDEPPTKRSRLVIEIPQSRAASREAADVVESNEVERYGGQSIISDQQDTNMVDQPSVVEEGITEGTTFYEVPQTGGRPTASRRDSDASDASFKTATSNATPQSTNPASPSLGPIHPIRSVTHSRANDQPLIRKRRRTSGIADLPPLDTFQSPLHQFALGSQSSPQKPPFPDMSSPNRQAPHGSSHHSPSLVPHSPHHRSPHGSPQHSPTLPVTEARTPVNIQENTSTPAKKKRGRDVFAAVSRRQPTPSSNAIPLNSQWSWGIPTDMSASSGRSGGHRRSNSSISRFTPIAPKPSPTKGQSQNPTSPSDTATSPSNWASVANQRYQHQLAPPSPTHRPAPRPFSYAKKGSLSSLPSVGPNTLPARPNFTPKHGRSKSQPSINASSMPNSPTSPTTPTTPSKSREGVMLRFKSVEEKTKGVAKLEELIEEDPARQGYVIVKDMEDESREREARVTGPMGANVFGWVKIVFGAGVAMERCFGAI